MWVVLSYLVCVCGLAISFLVTRGLVSGELVASGLMRGVQPLITQFPDLTAALIALISVALGYAGNRRLQTVREAEAALSTNNTIREAQERRAI
jgi:hypothetical protein